MLALFGALVGCEHHAAPRDPQTLIRLADDEVKSLDPQAVSDLASLRVASDQFEGLTRFNGFGKIEPGLADRWQHSTDGLIWTFHMRAGLHFSDGVAITPAIFVAGFARLQDARTASPSRPLFSSIDTLTAAGSTVVVRLKTPFPALPELLAHPAMAALPLHRPALLAERPMTTSGAYRATDWALNDHLTLIRNPAWHDGNAPVARVRWQPVSDPLAALRLFSVGDADTTSDLPSSRLGSLRKRFGAAVHTAPYNGSYYFVFNTRRPPFNDVRVRRALSMAIDRVWLSRTLLNIGNQPAEGVVPPGVNGADAFSATSAQRGYKANNADAAALLSAAGYGPNHRLSFDIRFNSDTDHRRVAVAMAAMWKPLGVDAHLLNSEAALHFAALRRGDFALARSGWIGDIAAPENYLSVYRSTAGQTNYSGYSNPKFDAALDHALAIANPEARQRAMRAAEAILMADAPIIPINYYVSKSLVAARVGGWHDNAAHIHPSRTLWIKG